MYKKLLVAIDLSRDSQKVVDAAVRMADSSTSNLHLVHVVEPIAGVYSMEIYTSNINQMEQAALELAEQQLGKIAGEIGIGVDDVSIILGAPAPEIRNLASKLDADVIVIGSHGHSGWKVLLGSTANQLLHGARCDVLTVYVGEE